MYNVYISCPIESTFYEYILDGHFYPASFDTLEEAIALVDRETRGRLKVDSRDNTLDHNTHYWFEVYDGLPIEDDVGKEPVFISDSYYYS